MSTSALQYYKITKIVQKSVQKLHSIETTKNMYIKLIKKTNLTKT